MLTKRSVSLVGLALAALLGGACGGDRIVEISTVDAGTNRTILADVGQEIDITLQNVGPAVYGDPPSVSSTAVAYLGVDVVGPYVPAGPTQRFRFRGRAEGDAVVRFRRILADSVIGTIEDTIRVH